MVSLLYILKIDIYSEVLKRIDKATALRATCTQLAALSRRDSQEKRNDLTKRVRIHATNLNQQCMLYLLANNDCIELFSKVYLSNTVQDPDGSLQRLAKECRDDMFRNILLLHTVFYRFLLEAVYKYSFDPPMRPMLQTAWKGVRSRPDVSTARHRFINDMNTNLCEIIKLSELVPTYMGP